MKFYYPYAVRQKEGMCKDEKAFCWNGVWQNKLARKLSIARVLCSTCDKRRFFRHFRGQYILHYTDLSRFQLLFEPGLQESGSTPTETL